MKNIKLILKTTLFTVALSSFLHGCKKDSSEQASLQNLKYELLTKDSAGKITKEFKYGEDIHFVLNETNMHETESINYILDKAPCQSLDWTLLCLI